MTPVNALIALGSVIVIIAVSAKIVDVYTVAVLTGLFGGIALFTAWARYAGYWESGPDWVVLPMLACLLGGVHIGHVVGERIRKRNLRPQ